MSLLLWQAVDLHHESCRELMPTWGATTRRIVTLQHRDELPRFVLNMLKLILKITILYTIPYFDFFIRITLMKTQ